MNDIIVKNLFNNLQKTSDQELIDVLFQNNSIRIERIISEGHTSPSNFWYDQDENEFVLLLSGKAILSFENENKIELNPGDYLIIPSHKKHRIDYTHPTEKTIWLTFFY